MQQVSNGNIPQHVGLIMDGNGRWAQKRLMPRSYGHSAGMKRMIGLAEKAMEEGVRYFTVYALSTENLARPEDELEGLFNLFRKYFDKNVRTMHSRGAAVRVAGDTSVLPEDVRRLIADGVGASPKEPCFTMIIALNYGARAEITRAVNAAVSRGAQVTEQDFARLLYNGDIPDPDLIIRTGGEVRLSNFLLWQAAYAELYFTDTLFPDFSDKEFERAINNYSKRTRRFGKV